MPGLRIGLLLGMTLLGLAAPLPGRTETDAWSPAEVAVLAALQLDGQQPDSPDPSNMFQASAAAAALGQRLFFDTRLSRNQAVACASCHDPDRHFQDGRPVGVGLGTGSRRSMPVVGAARGPWLFWDGRKDSLWSQALGPLEDPLEHGGNRLRYARLVQAHYGETYAEIFGALPDLAGLPEDASPLGTAAEQIAWLMIEPSLRENVSRVFANIGKAIAAYESTLRHVRSRVDYYIGTVVGDAGKSVSWLSPQEIRGLRLFIGKGQCVSCHNGPQFSDQQFHNTGVPPRDPAHPDRGRATAIAKVVDDEFNCLGRYSDAAPAQCEELQFLAPADERLEGAFKTPGLRGVASRPPYMHAGQFASLEDVVRHYVKAPRPASGRSELRQVSGQGRDPIRLSTREQRDLVAFLKAL